MKKECNHCGAVFTGRVDKIYCSTYCRASSHNQQKKTTSPQIRKINKILINNRRILKKLNPSGKSKIHREKLIEHGFRFYYCTNISIEKKAQYYFCYEYGYRLYNNGYCALITRESLEA